MLLKRLSLTAVPLLLAGILNGQYDSTAFNAGTLQLSRQFTQNITIKGEDLERFPFSSLEEAINRYFNGAYTNAQDLLYVIDGNVGADVNAYSIHDIESITLIQDARAVAAGVHRAQQLVIVQTRTQMTRSTGFTVAASGYLTRRRGRHNINLYNNLFASGRYSRRNLEIGASINYLHEAFPREVPDKTIHADPQHRNRYAVNAWLASTIGKSVLAIRFNASPQYEGSRISYMNANGTGTNEDDRTKNLQIYPTASLFTRFSPYFYNQMDGGYVMKNRRASGEQLINYGNGNFYNIDDNERSRYNLSFLREEFGFIHIAGKWHFNPALNIYGSYLIDKTTYDSTWTDNNGVGEKMSESKIKERGIVFTPVINVTNNLGFNFQGGFQLNTIKTLLMKRGDHSLHPFASLSVDVIKVINGDAPVSLILHGSYAEAKSDLLNYFNSSIKFYTYSDGLFDSISMPLLYGNLYKPLHTTTEGLTFSIMDNRFKFDYSHEQKGYFVDSYITTSLGSGNTIIINAAQAKLATHRFGVRYQTGEAETLQYSVSVSVYHVQSDIRFDDSNLFVSPVNSQQFFPQPGWSGGIINQVHFKRFEAGVSCLYYFDEHKWVSQYPNRLYPTLQKLNSIVLQHVYAGYQFKRFELYLSGRNILRRVESTSINGDIAYYGAGIKTKF